ncbi:uncharacterized protein LOC128160549 [Crassostrea angulata]|uniref:uncharacterized protein LOC128160549 n=1 Tax=Magallana angulata TaxID=2784310 RepID=UPI0022B12C2D|nr:uncharacterized protein LOC128160549 [Crassostrea angulata]
MYLRPLDICFSHDSIGRSFGRCTSHPYRPIGETLDDILTGKINVDSISSISVYKKNKKWFTADNRRLWVFQEAEKRGKCSEIYVRETLYIDNNKFTTKNNGVSVYVRGNPGGYLWRNVPTKSIQPNKNPKITSLQTIPTSSAYTHQKCSKETDTSGTFLTKLERNVPAFYEISMKDREEDLCSEKETRDIEPMAVDSIETRDIEPMAVDYIETRDIEPMAVDYKYGTQYYSIDVDSDSEDKKLPNFPFVSKPSNQQDNTNVFCQHCSKAKRKVTKTAMEEMVGDERKIKYREEAAINSHDIPRNSIYSPFLSSNSKIYEPLENRDAVVTIRNETTYVIDNFRKCSELKHCNFGRFCLILLVIALLCLFGIIIHEVT